LQIAGRGAAGRLPIDSPPKRDTTMSLQESDAPTRVERWTGLACDFAGLLLVALAILVNVEIVARGAFNTSTLLSDEYSGYLFVWLTLIGFGHALQKGAFLRVEGLIDRLPARARAWADVLSALVGLVVAAVCTYATATLVLASIRYGTLSIQPSATPLWLPQLVMPLGFAVLVLIYVGLAVNGLRRASADRVVR
jgi:TRAP-type C4-dicarboxylate transport system permease small subunit